MFTQDGAPQRSQWGVLRARSLVPGGLLGMWM